MTIIDTIMDEIDTADVLEAAIEGVLNALMPEIEDEIECMIEHGEAPEDDREEMLSAAREALAGRVTAS